MRRVLQAFCWLFCSLFISGVYAQALPVNTLSLLLKSFNTYQANFSQKTLSEQGSVIQTSNGVMMIKRPGHFRWESNKPTKQILITDGKVLWIYDVDLAQATKQMLASRTTIDPAMLLSGSLKDLNASFIVTLRVIGEDKIFTLLPKKQNMGFSKVTLKFHKNVLVAMTVINNLAQTTEFDFSDVELNKLLANALFTFTPPKGVDVVAQ